MPANIHTWSDLSKFGINPLTGEACKYGQRLLCDLSEDGVALVRDLFGLPAVVSDVRDQFPINWNSMVGDKPAIASIMLPRGMFGDICRFALFRAGYELVIWSHDGGWAGYMQSDIPKDITHEKLEAMYKAVYRNPAPGAASSRNQHAMSGRTL